MTLPMIGAENNFYNTVVDMIVDEVNKEYPNDGDARMRCYARISDSFDGLVRAMGSTQPHAALEEKQ